MQGLPLAEIAKTFEELDRDEVPGLLQMIEHTQKKNRWSGIRKLQWEEQTLVNLPILYLASILVHHHAVDKGCTNFLCATRDCVHFYKIFARMFPAYTIHYFHCSRIMLERATEQKERSYDRYVESVLLAADGLDPNASPGTRIKAALSKTMFVDLHGSGKRILQYCEKNFGAVPKVLILTARFRSPATLPIACRTYHANGDLIIPLWHLRGSPIEMLNYDLIGTLQNYSASSGAVRDPLEYSTKLIVPYHQCVKTACRVIMPFDLTLTSRNMYTKIMTLLTTLCQFIQVDKPVIAAQVKHIGHHVRAGEKAKERPKNNLKSKAGPDDALRPRKPTIKKSKKGRDAT